jgi:hypothetical protein
MRAHRTPANHHATVFPGRGNKSSNFARDPPTALCFAKIDVPPLALPEGGNQPILSPKQTIAPMSRDLQNELAVPSFVEEATGNRPFDRQSAKNKRPRRKAEVLRGALAIQPDTPN